MSDTSFFTSLSNHKKEFKTDNMNVPVVFHASNELLPNEETFNQLENLAEDKRIFHHIAAMSDVHPKKGRKNPTGTVVASKDYILPQINDTAPNCGMRLVKTSLNEDNITSEKIDELFQELVKVVPTKKFIGTKIPLELAMQICRSGIEPLKDFFETKTRNEIENTFKFGNFFGNENISSRDIRDVIPKLFIKIGSHRLGILGAAGNHFLDLMKITDIQNENIAKIFGIKSGQYVFLIHTGSGLLGQYASYMYTPKVKEHFSQKVILKLGTAFFDSQMKKVYCQLASKINQHKKRKEFFGYEDGSLESRMFIRSHRAAANFGFANRLVITHHIKEVMEKVLEYPVEFELLYDTPHVFIDRENHLGVDLWIHRNGAVRANGPKRMADHPIFSQTGEPVFIPSSMTTPACIGVGTDENESTFFSAGHGTGRKRETKGDEPKNKSALFEKVKNSHVKLYNAKSKGVVLQDSAYYKDVEEVVSGMVENKIIKVVAKMEPVAVLMY
jgi:tRNA-splicing ligase RtcB